MALLTSNSPLIRESVAMTRARMPILSSDVAFLKRNSIVRDGTVIVESDLVTDRDD